MAASTRATSSARRRRTVISFRIADGGHYRKQRRLPRGVRAEQPGDPPLQLEIDLVQGPGGAVPPRQAVDADGCGAHVQRHLIHPNSKRSWRASSTTAEAHSTTAHANWAFRWTISSG